MNLHYLDKNTLIVLVESLDATICDLNAALSDAQNNLHYANAEVERRGWQLDDANTSIRILQNKVATLSATVLKQYEDAVDNDVRAQLDALFAERGRRNKIAMIKVLKEATGLGLKEAKETIESWYAFEPYVE